MDSSSDAKHGPPGGWRGLLVILGPGIVVAGSVMGGGELINTPLQAAKFGFVLLWAVVIACVIKYFLQVELGRHCLVHGRTTVGALNTCLGPKVRGTSWVALAYMFGYTISLATAVGIIGSLVGLMQSIVPSSGTSAQSTQAWGVALIAFTQLILWNGAYRSLEKWVALMVGVFCIAVVAALLMIQGTAYRISGAEIASGFTFSLGPEPRLAAYAVISLMGALGTTANELFMYPYWIHEKGYARGVGVVHSDEWTASMRGWIRGLHLDAGFATIVATLATLAFYLLGASVLHRQGITPSGLDVVEQISRVFTQTYGSWSYALYMAGAFSTLFSTLVVATAATGRMWADVLGSMSVIDRGDPFVVNKVHRRVQTIYLVGMLAAFLTIQEAPAKLVVWGQFFAGVFNTPLIMFGICWAAFHTDRRLRMSVWSATALVGSTTVVLASILGGLAIQQGWISGLRE